MCQKQKKKVLCILTDLSRVVCMMNSCLAGGTQGHPFALKGKSGMGEDGRVGKGRKVRGRRREDKEMKGKGNERGMKGQGNGRGRESRKERRCGWGWGS